MFPLHYTTRRFICRTGFVLLCLFPTAAVLAWSGWLSTSAHVKACRAELARQLRLPVKLADVTHPEPGVAIFEGLELLDPHSRQRLAYVPRLEARDSSGKRLLIATGPEIEQRGLAQLQKMLDELFDRGEQCTLQTASLLVRLPDGEHELKDPRIATVRTTAGLELHAQCRVTRGDSAQPIKLHLLREAGEQSTTRVELDTGGGELPCCIAGCFAPWLSHLGEDASFQGALTLVHNDRGYSGEARGRLAEIDLARAIADNFPHRIDGRAELRIERARISQSRLVELIGQVQAGPGLIGPSLRIAAAEALELQASEVAMQPVGLLEYEQLAFQFKLDSTGLALSGRCTQAAPGAILIDRRQLLLGEPRRQPQPLAALIRALVPSGSAWVPASPQSAWLLDVLPLSDRPSTR